MPCVQPFCLSRRSGGWSRSLWGNWLICPYDAGKTVFACSSTSHGIGPFRSFILMTEPSSQEATMSATSIYPRLAPGPLRRLDHRRSARPPGLKISLFDRVFTAPFHADGAFNPSASGATSSTCARARGRAAIGDLPAGAADRAARGAAAQGAALSPPQGLAHGLRRQLLRRGQPHAGRPGAGRGRGHRSGHRPAAGSGGPLVAELEAILAQGNGRPSP
jgi:hypothetical protein